MSQEKIDVIQVIDDTCIKGFFGEYRFLSNYHLCDIEYEGLIYSSVENAFQAAKSLDENIRKRFLHVSPAEAKRMGKKVELREDWESVKQAIMYELNAFKYLMHKDLGIALVATGDRYLEETNWWNDTFWGVCNGEGLNRLGETLMRIRKGLAPYVDNSKG